MSVTHECFLCWAADEASCGCKSLAEDLEQFADDPEHTEEPGDG